MLSILHLIDGLERGGAERMVLEITRRLDRSRFRPRVASLSGPGALGAAFEAAGVEVLDLSGPAPLAPMRLARVLEEHTVDILHAHLVRSMLLARAARRAGQVQQLVTTQHFPPAEGGPGSPRELVRLTAADDDVAIAVSRSIANELEGQPLRAQRFVTIPNGVDLERFHPGVQPMDLGEGRWVGAAASLTHKKGLDVLIRALALSTEDWSVALAGVGPEREALVSLARELGVGDRVRFLGALEDVAPFLAALDVVCLPSRREPFGLAALEGMALGRPCVFTSVGGLAQIATDGESALYTPPEDAAALMGAVERLLGNREIASGLGARAVARAGGSSIEKTVEGYVGVYE